MEFCLGLGGVGLPTLTCNWVDDWVPRSFTSDLGRLPSWRPAILDISFLMSLFHSIPFDTIRTIPPPTLNCSFSPWASCSGYSHIQYSLFHSMIFYSLQCLFDYSIPSDILVFDSLSPFDSIRLDT